MIENYKQAIEISRIPRIDYKAILGKSLTAYLLQNKNKDNDTILRELLLILRKPENRKHLNGINLYKASENIKISLSARRTEQRIYGI